MKLEISISRLSKSFVPVHPQGDPNPQIDRILNAMARTVISTKQELQTKVNRTYDSKSCWGQVALNLNSYVGKPDAFLDDTIMLFGEGNYDRAEHCVMANPHKLTLDGSKGELRWSDDQKLQFWKYQLRGGDAGSWTHMDLIYYIPVKDFFQRYVQSTLHSKLVSTSSDEDFVPPANAASAAVKSLEWRKQYGRGMTSVGLARANQLKNRQKLSLRTLKRMVSFFARHEVDKQSKAWTEGHSDGGPSNGKIAWYGWGGDAGWSWAKRIVAKYQTES